jgi:hypothetical protein
MRCALIVGLVFSAILTAPSYAFNEPDRAITALQEVSLRGPAA